MSFPSDESYDESDNDVYTSLPAGLAPSSLAHYFVGFECGAVAGADKLIQPPKIPKNYTKPESIQAYHNTMMERRIYEAGMMPIVGELHSAVLVDKDGLRCAGYMGRENGGPINDAASCDFGSYLMELVRNPNRPTVIWGFNIHDMMRILAFRVVRVRPSLLAAHGITSWWENPWLQDPRKRLLKTSVFNAIGVAGLAYNVGVNMNYSSAATRAESVRQLCIRYTLAQ